MPTKRLTIADIQIYFNDAGAAHFEARGKQRAAVEMELTGYREFIDRWLEASEEPLPRQLSSDEQQLRTVLRALVKSLKRHFDKNFIETVLRVAAKHREESTRLSQDQIDECVTAAIASLRAQ